MATGRTLLPALGSEGGDGGAGVSLSGMVRFHLVRRAPRRNGWSLAQVVARERRNRWSARRRLERLKTAARLARVSDELLKKLGTAKQPKQVQVLAEALLAEVGWPDWKRPIPLADELGPTEKAAA